MNTVKLWLDDIRPPPEGWTWAKTAPEAISILDQDHVIEISLDHDLGDDILGTGYEVACYIERHAYQGDMGPMKWTVHSVNPVGRKRIETAMKSADRLWSWDKE